MVKETKTSLISRPSALFPFSKSLSLPPPPLPFSSLLTSNYTGSDLTATETPWGSRHPEKGQCHGLCVMQVKPSHGDSLRWQRGTRLSAPSHLERLFWSQR